MKKSILVLLTAVICVACNEKKITDESLVIHDTVDVADMEDTSVVYPEALTAIFEAHGGVATWQKMNNLCFEFEGRNGAEIHTTDLGNRLSKIEHKDWSIGYDGKDVWLLQNKEDAYQRNARFYHNLMFYFYAMPFILSDDGIVYTDVAETELDGKMYKGIHIGYKDDVGDSPEDEYILFYDADTNKMAWLGYTVTYRSGEKSDDWHFIKYDKWQEVNGVLLPEKLTWYNVNDGKPTDERNDVIFKKVTVSTLKLDDAVFAKPEAAIIVPKK